MTQISAATIKTLREKSGAGMMDCKKALVECGGDLEEAVDWLRKKGLAAASKKAGRVAAEGLVAVAQEAQKAVLVELNSETDFVARNDEFQTVLENLAAQVLATGEADVDALKQTTCEKSGKTVEVLLNEAVGVIGENIQLRRVDVLEGDIVVSYVHNAVKPGMGTIGVLVALRSEGARDVVEQFGRQVAMHVAAIRPEALTVAELDPALVERERTVLSEQARASGKPENVIEKMIGGRLQKFYGEVVLLEQPFVMDGKTPVKQAAEEAAKEAGAAIEITGYRRFTLGEGVEKREENFAEEVAAAVQG